MSSPPNKLPSRVLDDPIGLFMPGCTDDERRLRERLLKAREFATARAVHLRSADARIFTWQLLDTVTVHLYASATLEELEDALEHCLRLSMCARYSERLAGAAS
jgi:hypothetical protein